MSDPNPNNLYENRELAQTCIMAIRAFGPAAMVALNGDHGMIRRHAANVLADCWEWNIKFTKGEQPK